MYINYINFRNSKVVFKNQIDRPIFFTPYSAKFICAGISLILFLSSFSLSHSYAQNQSIAREWNEILLEGIRNDYARPTVHARNLFHSSLAMYDIWALSDSQAETYILGKKQGPYESHFDSSFVIEKDYAILREAISFANYRLLKHRFRNSPDFLQTVQLMNSLFVSYGYDTAYTDTNYLSGNPAALGNYVAQSIIEFGRADGSNEQNDYANIYYQVYNEPMNPNLPGVQRLRYPNRWQPLSLDVFIDQSGNVIPGATPEFLSPDWGRVLPFSLSVDNLSFHIRDRDTFWVYHDPGPPPLLDLTGDLGTEEYQWNFSIVSIWGSHLDPGDSVLMDISPGRLGNMELDSFMDYQSYYDYFEGGDISSGHAINPKTGEPYEPQWVPRGDYSRVLAEFWADGPDSETPPGHWFTILNSVNDHPALEKKYRGQEVLDNLEWDIKSYFALGGAMHDAAIAAWSIKGWYDYIRPISAIRSLADRGQSTDTSRSNYHPAGIPLQPGLIEVVDSTDELAGNNFEQVGKIKLYTWRGPDYIENDSFDVAGVGWILAENWWPYQRPTFVTPPFAGYISGHSTFSRAAAEVLTAFTGDPFFPGGLGEFICKKNEFLVFEDGPSQNITLQWATYRDASDQTSLSRIWGGIHPPIDDIPGRLIGERIGKEAFSLANKYFMGTITTHSSASRPDVDFKIYPNPNSNGVVNLDLPDYLDIHQLNIYAPTGQMIKTTKWNSPNNMHQVGVQSASPGIYFIEIVHEQGTSIKKLILK